MTITRIWLGAGVAAIAALFVPHILSPGLDDWAIRFATLLLIAVSWNLMANAGLVSLGHSGFWGLGAYAAGLFANTTGLPFWLSILPSIALGALFGVLLASITARLRGLFFAISTLALAEALRVVAFMVPALTGGAEGFFVDDHLRPPREILTSCALIIAVAAIAVSIQVSNSRYQYGLRAMRDSESASMMLGVNPARFRIGITALSGALASAAGAISAWYTGYLEPSAAFDMKITISAQIAPLFGGLYTVVGPVVGSFALLTISELTRLQFGHSAGVGLLAYGVVLVFGVMFMPAGIVGVYRRLTAKRKEPGALNG